jgi:hypothetical protein
MNKLAVIVTFILAILTCNSQPKYNIPDLQLYDLDSNLVSLHALLDDGPVFICVWRRRRGQPSTLNTNFSGPKLDQGSFSRAYLPKYRVLGAKATDGRSSVSNEFHPTIM